MSNTKIFRLGSRSSELALWQTQFIRDLLRAAWPKITIIIEMLTTSGDRLLDTPLPLIGGKGLFTSELEQALRAGHIDAAVHSLKDLPTELPEGLIIGAIPPRANPADVLVSRLGLALQELPAGATVGTSSRRRAAQLLALRPDLKVEDIRGNVPTRLRKVMDPAGPYDAILLAYAGLERLGMLDGVTQHFTPDEMLPAPGQGALAVQCRDDPAARDLISILSDPHSASAVTAERAFLAGLGGGCSLPIASHAVIQDGKLYLHGRVSSQDGSRQIDVRSSGSPAQARQMGADLAWEALSQGAAELLEGMS